jgi:hypothetical protein
MPQKGNVLAFVILIQMAMQMFQPKSVFSNATIRYLLTILQEVALVLVLQCLSPTA